RRDGRDGQDRRDGTGSTGRAGSILNVGNGLQAVPDDCDGREIDQGFLMIKSMTGFSALTREDDRATIAVTIRAVNHRHLDVQLRSPQSLSSIEGDLRALVAKHVARGRVELGVSLQFRQTPGV